MRVQITGDTLALDADIRRQIESEAENLAAHVPGGPVVTRARICEEFDPVHGHRVRCELLADLRGRQVVVREARKDAAEAISKVFEAALRSARRVRRRLAANPIPTPHAVGLANG